MSTNCFPWNWLRLIFSPVVLSSIKSGAFSPTSRAAVSRIPASRLVSNMTTSIRGPPHDLRLSMTSLLCLPGQERVILRQAVAHVKDGGRPPHMHHHNLFSPHRTSGGMRAGSDGFVSQGVYIRRRQPSCEDHWNSYTGFFAYPSQGDRVVLRETGTVSKNGRFVRLAFLPDSPTDENAIYCDDSQPAQHAMTG